MLAPAQALIRVPVPVVSRAILAPVLSPTASALSGTLTDALERLVALAPSASALPPLPGVPRGGAPAQPVPPGALDTNAALLTTSTAALAPASADASQLAVGELPLDASRQLTTSAGETSATAAPGSTPSDAPAARTAAIAVRPHSALSPVGSAATPGQRGGVSATWPARPARPAPIPAGALGSGPAAGGAPAGAGLASMLALAALLLLIAPGALRRLREISALRRTAPFQLIPQRPG
jgi:hypothetical protein